MPALLEPDPDLTVIEAADVPLAAAPEERATGPAPVPPPPLQAIPLLHPDEPSTPLPDLPARRRSSRLIGPLGLGLLAGCLVFFVIGLGGLGVVEGLRIRSRNQTSSAAQHYTTGVGLLEKGEYERAAAEFEYALRLRPAFPEAQAKLTEARSRATSQPTPVTPPAVGKVSQLLAEARAAYERGAWDEVIGRLEDLRAVDPKYEQTNVQNLLVLAYTNSGLKLVNDDRLEEAIRRFDQALALQPDNPDVLNQRRLAALYQSALSAWGVDWKQAIRGFQSLYALKPDFKDTAQRLYRANLLAGDAAMDQSAWCEAMDYYKAALGLSTTPEVATKRDDAARRCNAPVGTPQTPVPTGTFVGVYAGQEDIRFRTNNWAKVTGRVVNAKGEGVPGLQVRISAFTWSAVAGTDINGYYAFEFLTTEANYTVTLLGHPAQPIEVPAKFGYSSIANFEEKQ